MTAQILEVKTGAAKRNENTIKVLREMLSDAEDGKIESFLAVTFNSSGGYAVIGSGGVDVVKKIGALEVLKMELRDWSIEANL